MKSIVVFFIVLIFSAQAYNACAENLNDKKQLVFLKTMDSYVKNNESRLQYLLHKNSDEIVGLELIIASGTENGAVYSKWGHALLRFVDNDGIWSNDITINFVALVNTPQLSLVKGLTGGYDVLPEVKTLYEFWIQYVQAEDRPLDRFIIPTSPSMVKKLLLTLKAWSEEPEKIGNYKFIGNNCVGVLSKLLSESGIVPNNQKAIVPTNFSARLDQIFVSPFEKIVVKSPFYILPRANKLLGITPSELLNGTSWPSDASEKLVSNFNNDELMFLYQSIPLLPSDVSTDILRTTNDKTKVKNYKNFLGFALVPESLYHLCFDKECANQIFASEKKLWGRTTALEKRSKRITSFFQRKENTSNIDSEQIASFQNIVDTQVELGDYRELFRDKIILSSNSKIELALKIRDGEFYLMAYTQDEINVENGQMNIVNEKLNSGIFEIQNNNEVFSGGKIVGKIIKKTLDSDQVQFYSPYSLVHHSIGGNGHAFGLVAPSF